ncbi:MAG: peptidyl-prolyl cis-trans isomerase [Desulfuromonadales bacterium]|nr:peptidyl-prolyl cis-trans isomerase [Desulfuromonadales bacterium]MBN2790953.1 peptidyl-prolyl cis-trans isomerase [Desulfuromonadales bacterium]
MQKSLYRLVSALTLLLLSAFTVHAFAGAGAALAPTETGSALVGPEITVPLRIKGKLEQVPLFSDEHAQTPVAMINEEPITLRELATELAAMHSSMGDSGTRGKQDFNKILERLVTIKLIKQEALNIGFDRTPAFQKQVEDFALKNKLQLLLKEQLKSIELDQTEVEKLYQDMAIEAKLLTYGFAKRPDAEAFMAELENDADFKQLADQQVAAGKAEGGEDEDYVKLIELLPTIAQAVYDMESGAISEIFKGQDNYLVFKLVDKRVYEDADVRQKAASQIYQREAKTAQDKYFKSLEEKYVRFDEEVLKVLDFAAIVAEQPGVTGTEVFSRLMNDRRPLARIGEQDPPQVITVAEIVEKLKAKMFHGTDREVNAEEMDTQKDLAIQDRVIALTGSLEADRLGIDQRPEYQAALAKFEERLLFDTFISKAVIPGIKVPEDDAKAYYYNNLEEYSSPLMLKMSSLVFTDQASASEALAKLRAGSDFRWVSANSENLAAGSDVNILSLGGSLLAVTALPEDLQKTLAQARQGDLFLYDGPENLYYLLQVDNAYPPKAQRYEEVRQEVGKIIYAQKINEAVEDWVAKLKEAYETEIFIEAKNG